MLETINKESTRTKVVTLPAKQIITQPVHQDFVHHQVTNHIHKPVIKKKYVVRKVKVPTPVIQKIPIVRNVQARVKTEVLPAQTLALKGSSASYAASGFSGMSSAYASGDAAGYSFGDADAAGFSMSDADASGYSMGDADAYADNGSM